jgi:hypothetical protein
VVLVDPGAFFSGDGWEVGLVRSPSNSFGVSVLAAIASPHSRREPQLFLASGSPRCGGSDRAIDHLSEGCASIAGSALLIHHPNALVTAEKFGYGPTYLDEYPARIKAVTTAQANAAMRKYFAPGKLHVIVSGDLDKLPD